MVDREIIKEIIDGLRCAIGDPMPCAECRYREYMYSICKRKCVEDAIALLKAQQPRVMTMEEVEDALDTVVWVDRPDMENMSEAYALISAYSRVNKEIWLQYGFIEKPKTKFEPYGDYGITYRCWTSRPTDAQREATPWE